jgi:hypothetical protein
LVLAVSQFSPTPRSSQAQLCQVLDAAEFCRNVHADEEWRRQAQQVTPHSHAAASHFHIRLLQQSWAGNGSFVIPVVPAQQACSILVFLLCRSGWS